MVLLTILALVLGVLVGLSGIDFKLLEILCNNTDIVLYFLMFFVGIMVGLHEGLLKDIKDHGFKILLVPILTIMASIVAGVVCMFITNYSIYESIALSSGMGWYSLSGVALGSLGGAELGSVAFISNLMREIFSFALIPIIAKYLNPYAAVACAGATSEDTTLPIIMKSSSPDIAIVSVINGIICSACVPIIFSIFMR